MTAFSLRRRPTVALAGTVGASGDVSDGVPDWTEGRTPLAWFSLAPTATIASLDPKNDGALNPNGAGNTAPWHNASNPQSTFLTAWGGGAYNPVTKKLRVAGGGHAGYMGNEIYSADLSADAPTYTRLCPPSGSTPRPADFSGGNPISGTNNDVCTDERPKAVHSYGILAQDDTGRFYQMPGGFQNTFGLGGGVTQRAFRFSGSDWDATSAEVTPGFSGPGTAAYDAAENAIWHAWGTRLRKFNLDLTVAATYTIGNGSPYYGTMSIADADGYVLSFDGGNVWPGYLFVFARSAPGTVGYHRDGGGSIYVATAGTAPPAPSNKYYASAWDSIRRRLLIYNGGSRMFTLTPPGSGSWVTGTWTWGELTCSTASYTPPTDSGNGIFGRFFFDPDYNCAVCQPSDVDDPLIVLPLEAV